jgi:hypothetical protein
MAPIKRAKAKSARHPRKEKSSPARKADQSPKKLIAALQVAASHLKTIENEADVADFIEYNCLGDDETIQKLRKSCTAISKLLRAKASPVDAEGGSANSSTIMDPYFVYRAASNSVMLLAPVEELRCNRYYSNRKVLGFVRRPGENFPLMLALPGWNHCADHHPRLLDSEIWCEYVLQFAAHLDYQIQLGAFDIHHKKQAGSQYASHCEPKLMLWFACHIFTKRMKEEFNLKKLYLLRKLKTKIEAEIIISEAPCSSCTKFKELIEFYTGLKFTFKVCKNLGMLKSYRDAYGIKKYPRLASEEPEFTKGAEEDYEQRYPLQAPSPNVMVIVKVLNTEIQSVSKISKLKQPRKRRQYDDDSDDEDYQEPRRRAKVPNEERAR